MRFGQVVLADWGMDFCSCPKGAMYPSPGLSSHRLGYPGGLDKNGTNPKGVV